MHNWAGGTDNRGVHLSPPTKRRLIALVIMLIVTEYTSVGRDLSKIKEVVEFVLSVDWQGKLALLLNKLTNELR